MLLRSAAQHRARLGCSMTEARLTIDPVPSEEEAAAIVAAIELSWPRAAAESSPESSPRWRFSGRWWTKPVPTGRARP
jgi:hypothetical protein